MSPLFRAVVGYFFAAIIVTFPLVLSLDKSLSDPVDPVLNSWILAWEHYALLNEPGELFNANIFYPYKNTLLYSETLLLPSLLLLPIQIAGANAVLIHNLLVLLGFTLTGISGYLLGRWLFRNAWSGWLLGGIFAFNSYTLSNIGQAQLLHLEWLPLALLYLGKLLRVPTVRSAALLAAFLTAQFYTTIYYGIFGFLLIALVGGVVWLFMDYARVEVRWRALVLLACAIGLALLLCLPLGVRYYEVSQANHFYRTLSEAWPFSASFENWLAAPPNNLTWGWYFAKDLPVLGAYQIDALFPGIILALAAITGLALWLAHALTNKGRRGAAWRWPLLLLLALLFFFVLSFGPYFQRESLQPDFAQRLPYAWIHEWVPGFSALRAPVRFATTVYLGLATLVAYLAYRMRRRIHRMALLMLIAVEAVAVTPMTTFVPAATSDLQQAQRWLAEQPRGAYLELPIYSFAGEGDELQWLESQFQSINHWHASPFGYSGFFPPRHFELHDFLTAFPRKEVVAFLQASGIEWVVMQPAKMSADEWPAIQEAAKERGWQLQHWGEVWLLQLPNVPVQEPQVSYHVPEVAQRGGVVTIGAVFVSDQPVPVVADSDLGSVKAEWWQGERRVLTASSV
ncbi:MAG: hypothetical protein IT328_00140, partial [Caldilineaceae bacterium]|nr:hypothetical protein [Caldilineaceae bacterium]